MTVHTYGSYQGLDPRSMASRAGKEFGLEEGQMEAVGGTESGFNPNAKAKTSSATGLYQFTSSTWKEQLGLHGAKYGIPADAQPTDPIANTILGAAYLKQNSDDYEKRFGTKPSKTDVYMGHFLGIGGRAKFKGAYDNNPNTLAKDAMSPEQYEANKSILEGKTVLQVYEFFENKMNAHGGQAKKDHKFGLDITKGQAPAVLETMDHKPEDVPEEKGIFDNLWKSIGGSWELNTISRVNSALDREYNPANMDEQAIKSAEEATGTKVSTEQKTYIPSYYTNQGKPDEKPFSYYNVGSKVTMSQEDPEMTLDIAPEAIQKMLDDNGLSGKWAKFIAMSTNAEDLAKRLDEAKTLDTAKKDANSGGIGSQLAGGIIASFGEGSSYVPFALGSSFAGKVAMGAISGSATGVFDEYLMESHTKGGIEGDYTSAALGGAIFGGGMGFLGGAVGAYSARRMAAREQAIANGAEVDPSLHPTIRAEEGKYVDSPDESGAVINSEGQILSQFNPNNPKTQAVAAEVEEAIKGNMGITPVSRDLQDISVSVFRSKHEDVRAIGSNLLRSSTGKEGGGAGFTRMVADDILQQLNMRDNATYFDLNKQLDAAVDTGMFQLKGNAEARTANNRLIIESLETGDISKLSPEQLKVMKTIGSHFERKFDAATNTTRFGNPDAPPVFNSRRDSKRYFPAVYEEGKRAAHVERFGDEKGLQTAIANNWKAQFNSNHGDVQAKFKDMFKDEIAEGKKLETLVDKYINDKAFGISHKGDFCHSSGIVDNFDGRGSSVTTNNDFTKERNIFDSAYRMVAEDGKEFSMNDLRHFDIMNIMGMYDKRMNGDIAIHGSTGGTTKALTQKIAQITDPLGRKDLEEVVKGLTGRSRRDEPLKAPAGFLRGLQDIAFAARGSMMWMNQLAEGAGFAANRTMNFLRNMDRSFAQLTNPQSKFSRKDMKAFQRDLFGLEFNDILTPSFSDYKKSMMNAGSSELASNVSAGFRTGAAALARVTPWGKLLTKSTQKMIDMARSSTLGDVASDALSGKTMFTKEMLRSADITPAQYEGIKALMKQHLKEDGKGNLSIDTKAILNDVRTNDLWRLADHVASETVFRTNRVGQMFTRQPSPAMGAMLQFKSFMIKGLNGRFMRAGHELFKDGRVLDHSMHVLLGVAFSGVGYAMRSHLTAWSLPEERGQKFLDKALSPATLAYNAVSRSSILGIPLGAVGLIGPDGAKMGRTTLEGDRFNEEANSLAVDTTTSHELLKQAGKTFTDAVPAAGVAASGYSTVKSGLDWLMAEEGHEGYEHKKAFIGNVRGVLPNDPLTQKLVTLWAEEMDVYDK